MDHLPIFVRLKGQTCLVVGGGAVAERKVALLRRAGARVVVIAPELNEALGNRRDRKEIDHRAARFDARDVQGKRLVIAASGDASVNGAVARAAEEAGVLCNVVDNGEESGFILPAIVDRSPVLVAIGTGGHAPVLAQGLKTRIEAWMPARIGELALRAGAWRGLVKKRFASLQERRRFWQRLFDGPIAEHILANRVRKAEDLVRRELVGNVDSPEETCGEAYIVGAGPGDPGLVTIRAQQLISQADVILYDRLVAKPILDYARKEADLICVGKPVGGSKTQQQSINDLLIHLVRQGRRVCRLKGGDPFVFGRGGEEVAALKAAGLPFQIVPGISAALGCAAYAGIPLTLRGVSGSVTLATAKLDFDRAADWQALARPGQTLALYMSAGSLARSAAQLMRHGLAGATPAAVVQNGTTGCQRVLHSTLERIEHDAAIAGVAAPAMFFVGAAVAQASAWFACNENAVTAGTASGTPQVVAAARCL